MNDYEKAIEKVKAASPEELLKLKEKHQELFDILNVMKDLFQNFTEDNIDIYNGKIQAVIHGWLASKNLYILMAMLDISSNATDEELESVMNTAIEQIVTEARHQYKLYKEMKIKD
jgi:hypothetical protein